MNVWSVKYYVTKFYIEEEEQEEEEEGEEEEEVEKEEEEEEEETLDSEINNYGLSKAEELHEGLG